MRRSNGMQIVPKDASCRRVKGCLTNAIGCFSVLCKASRRSISMCMLMSCGGGAIGSTNHKQFTYICIKYIIRWYHGCIGESELKH